METETDGDRKINDIPGKIKEKSRLTVADLEESKIEHAQQLQDEESHNNKKADAKLEISLLNMKDIQ